MTQQYLLGELSPIALNSPDLSVMSMTSTSRSSLTLSPAPLNGLPCPSGILHDDVQNSSPVIGEPAPPVDIDSSVAERLAQVGQSPRPVLQLDREIFRHGASSSPVLKLADTPAIWRAQPYGPGPNRYSQVLLPSSLPMA